jgi:uncharacterized membrane protein YvbJ
MKMKQVVIAVFVVVILLCIGVSFYFFNQSQQTQKEIAALKKDLNVIAKAEAKSLVEKVGNSLELPKDEEPTVATITDINKLKGQQFFAKAKNGDKLLIYTKTKKAILYRPSTGKIIEVAPLNIGKQQSNPTPANNTLQQKSQNSPSPTKNILR